MKTILLTVFLILSLALPLIVAFEYKKSGMLIPIVWGGLIYLLSTALANFISLASGLSSLTTADDQLTYVVIVTLSLSLVIGMFGLTKKVYSDEKTSNLIYSGFAMINTFIYNMNSYSFLVFISVNQSVDQLAKYYPKQTSEELLKYFDNISIQNLLLLIAELFLVFLILKALFCLVCRKEAKVFDYLVFVIGLFLLFYSQYCIENKLIVFVVYLCLFLAGYKGRMPIRRKDQYEK